MIIILVQQKLVVFKNVFLKEKILSMNFIRLYILHMHSTITCLFFIKYVCFISDVPINFETGNYFNLNSFG